MVKEGEKGSLKGQKERVYTCVRVYVRARARKGERGRRKERGKGSGEIYRGWVAPLTKDGVKMEGEKCGKGRESLRSYSLFLPSSFSFFPVSFWAFRWEYAYRNALEDFEISQVASPGRARQLFKAISISEPNEGYRCLMLRARDLRMENILKASIPDREKDGIVSLSACGSRYIVAALRNPLS